MLRSFVCSLAKSIARAIVIEPCDFEGVSIPTEVPGVPSFASQSQDAAIGLTIHEPTTGGRAEGSRYRLRRRNNRDTRWGQTQPPVDVGDSRSVRITAFNTGNAIENDRKYQVSVQAYNRVGDSDWSSWQTVTPTSV